MSQKRQPHRLWHCPRKFLNLKYLKILSVFQTLFPLPLHKSHFLFFLLPWIGMKGRDGTLNRSTRSVEVLKVEVMMVIWVVFWSHQLVASNGGIQIKTWQKKWLTICSWRFILFFTFLTFFFFLLTFSEMIQLFKKLFFNEIFFYLRQTLNLSSLPGTLQKPRFLHQCQLFKALKSAPASSSFPLSTFHFCWSKNLLALNLSIPLWVFIL